MPSVLKWDIFLAKFVHLLYVVVIGFYNLYDGNHEILTIFVTSNNRSKVSENIRIMTVQ